MRLGPLLLAVCGSPSPAAALAIAAAAASARVELGAGVLRADGRVLLDGLSTALRPNPSATGLFVHADVGARRAASAELPLGMLHCSRLLACARVSRYWMSPAFGTRAADVPHDTQFLLVELSRGGPYALLLPLVDTTARASLHGAAARGGWGRAALGALRDGPRALCVHVETGDACTPLPANVRALYVAAGDDPYELLHRGFSEVAERTRTFVPRASKRAPASLDAFGWCTWDAFYSSVTPADVLRGLGALRGAGAPPRLLILDDGWQSVEPRPSEHQPTPTDANPPRRWDARRLGGALLALFTRAVAALYARFVERSQHGSPASRLWRLLAATVLKGQLRAFFDAETDFARQLSSLGANAKFAGGAGPAASLGALVNAAKGDHGVRWVYAWHALHGYWRGVTPALGAALGPDVRVEHVRPRPSAHLLRTEPQFGWDPTVLFGAGIVADDADGRGLAAFYAGLHGHLADAGVDGVKVDVQAGVAALGGGNGGGAALARRHVRALEASAREHFGRNLLHCMCHTTETLYEYSHGAVARASDDFYPDRPDSHTLHVLNCAYNSIFIGEIAYPDWDMFKSRHESAALHAAARAVGGSPVYVSDKPGEHDAELLRRLVLPDGSVLRAVLPGRPTRDCLFADVARDGVSALKVWNVNRAGGAVVGAFNVQGVGWSHRGHGPDVAPSSPPSVSAIVRPDDAEPLRGHVGEVAVWRHRAGALQLLPSAQTALHVELAHREWEIFAIAPVVTVRAAAPAAVRFAPIGLGEMLNAGGAIIDCELRADDDGVRAELTCRGPGRLIAFADPAPSAVTVSGPGGSVEAPFAHNAATGTLTVELGAEQYRPDESDGATARVIVEWR